MDFALIETFRFEPATGFLRLGRHIARLERSARALGFSYDLAAIDSRLLKLRHSPSALRVRLELARDGAVTVSSAPFNLQGNGAVWKVAMAAATLDSHDGLLAHKTTRRRIYEQARAEHLPENIQEVILANQRGEICEGTITNIFVRPRGTAHLLTPPVECGLLPGVLRSELLEYGQVREELIRPGDLENAEEIFVGNSLRGLLRASLVSG